MKNKIFSLLIIAALAGCNKNTDDTNKIKTQTSTLPAAPSVAYEQLIVTDNIIANVFTISEDSRSINYQSRAGAINVLEKVLEDVDLAGYIKVEKAYKFAEKYIIIFSTGEKGASCPATTYAFAFDTKTESVIGKKELDGCSENIESFSEGNKLIIKKEGSSSTFFNASIE